MKINCLSCGFNINLDETYEDYKGEIKCCTCHALLEVKIEEDKLKSIKFDKNPEKAAE